MTTHGDGEADRRPAGPSTDRATFQFVLCLIPTLPLVADWVATAFGWRVFFLADPHIQAVWATILVLGGTWPFYAAGWGRPRSAVGATSLLIALGATASFAFGMYLTLFRHDVRTHPYFQVEGTLLTVATGLWLADAWTARRRPHRIT